MSMNHVLTDACSESRSAEGAAEVGSTPLRSALFSTVRLNPYVSLLADGIRQADPGIVVDKFSRLTLGWFLRKGHAYDIVHIHWAELQYQAGSRLARGRRFASFLTALMASKRRGARLVYTVHNVAQHEGRHERLNRWTNRAMFAWADAIHVHDPSVARRVRALVGTEQRLFVIPHGNYVGCYPSLVTAAEARVRLGLQATNFVFLALGGLRPYKGIEELITAFRESQEDDAREDPNPSSAGPAALVIAGHPHEPSYAERLRALAGDDRRIRLFLEHVPDEQLQVFMNAADLCVFPYRQVTTSGAAVLALSFGKPILAPAIGPFPALVDQSAGLVYDSADQTALTDALRRARAVDWGATHEAVSQYLDTISWPNVGRQHAAMYREIAARGASINQSPTGGRHD